MELSAQTKQKNFVLQEKKCDFVLKKYLLLNIVNSCLQTRITRYVTFILHISVWFWNLSIMYVMLLQELATIMYLIHQN